MLVFITNPKYFDKKSIKGKNVDLIFIFGSKRLCNELSKNNKCVNIGVEGKILQENFFPQAKKYNKNTRDKLLDIKINCLYYFKKLHHNEYKVKMQIINKHDPIFNLNVYRAKRMKDFNDAAKIIDLMIVKYIYEILNLRHGKRFSQNHKTVLKRLLNVTSAFYRAYIYSFGFDRGMEVFADIYKYSFFKNVSLFYTFNKYDIYQNSFHYNYLKVLSRLFIENIHKKNLKNFVTENINYYKERGWL